MKTGQTVDDPGLYSTKCCNVEVVFDPGDTFSRCPRCQHLCQWEFDCELVTSGDLDLIHEMAARSDQ
jgi:hypothetical protein